MSETEPSSHLPVTALLDADRAAVDSLRDRAFLHDDPAAYQAGVRDALRVLATPPQRERPAGDSTSL